jgi:hypothetical protein
MARSRRIGNVLEYVTYANAQHGADPIEELGVYVAMELAILRKTPIDPTGVCVSQRLGELVQRHVSFCQQSPDTPTYHAHPRG